MERIGEALDVSNQTVGRDLGGFSTMEKPPRPKGGRPKGKQSKSEAPPKPHATLFYGLMVGDLHIGGMVPSLRVGPFFMVLGLGDCL